MGQTVSIDQYLYIASKNGDLKKEKQAIENGANVNAKDDEYGWTPLHCACGYNGRESIVSLLLKNGPDVNAKSNYGWTPLHYASIYGYESTVSLLLENGADVNAKDNGGETPLHKACYNGHENIVSLLLKNGAVPTITNENGKTPLQIAQERNKQKCVAAIRQFEQRQQDEEQKQKEERQQLQREKEAQQRRQRQQEEEEAAKTKRVETEQKGLETDKKNELVQENQAAEQAAKREEQLTKQQEMETLKQLEKRYSSKFKTRASLDRELKRLQDLINAAKGSFDPAVNAEAEIAFVEHQTLLPLCQSPKYASVTDLGIKIASLEERIMKMQIGKGRTKAAKELHELISWWRSNIKKTVLQ
jgi:flagellar biosynthesis GTPase FlhF